MKHLKYTAAVCFFLCMLCACTQEEIETNAVSESIALKLNILGSSNERTRSTAEVPILNESTISNVYVFVYKDDASDTHPSVFFYEETDMNASGSWSKSFVKSLTGLEDGTNYDVYVLANIPSASSAFSLTKETTKTELFALKEPQNGNRATDGSDISFSGKSVFRCGTDSEMQIELKRTVARLDITINQDEIGDCEVVSVEVCNENAETFYFSDNVRNGNTRNTDKGEAWKVPNNTNLYRYYMYENEASTNEIGQVTLLITVKNKPTNEMQVYKAVVNKLGNSLVERNTIYKLTLKLKYSDVDVDCEIVGDGVGHWDETLFEIPLEYVDLQFKDTLILNDYGTGVLHISTNAEFITVDYSNAPGIVTQHALSSEVPVEGGGRELVFAMSSPSQESYKGEVKITAGNITKKLQVIKKQSSSWFVFTPDPNYPDGHVFPWYLTLTSSGDYSTIKFTYDRNLPTWYRYDTYYVLPDGTLSELHIMYLAETIAIPDGVTSYNFDIMSEIGANNSSEFDMVVKVHIGYLDYAVGPVAKTLTYTIKKYDGIMP